MICQSHRKSGVITVCSFSRYLWRGVVCMPECRPLGAPSPTSVLTCQQACTSWQGSHTNSPDWLAGTGQQGVSRQGPAGLVWLALVMCLYWWLGVLCCQVPGQGNLS